MNQTALARGAFWGTRLCACLAVLSGAIWLVAWESGAAARWSAAGLVIAKANMALCQITVGTGLLLIGARTASVRKLGAAFGAFALAVGAITLTEHVFRIDLGIDQLLASEPPGAPATTSPNRMGIPGSLSLLLLGAGLIAGTRKPRTLPHFGLAVCFINLIPLIGFLYRIEEFNSVSVYGAPTGQSRAEAIDRVQALSLLVLADRLDHSEPVPEIKSMFEVNP